MPHEPQTIAQLFYSALEFNLPDALAYREGGQYRGLSHAEIQAQVERLALALLAEGFKPGDRLAILSENRPEWAILDFACALTGIVSVPIYPTLNAPQIAFILGHSGARWVVCATKDHLNKVGEGWPELPALEAVVVLHDAPRELPGRRVMRWAELMEAGSALEARRPEVRALAEARRPGDLLTLIYTSGTTADPKGVMLSHANICSNVAMCLKVIQPRKGERSLSFLPLSHIFERTAGHYVMFNCGTCIYYAESFGALASNMVEVKPDILLLVPRVLEKIYTRVRDAAESSGFLKAMVFGWALAVGRKVARRQYRGLQPSALSRLWYRLADRLVLSRIRERTGGRLRFAVSGGAALNPRLVDFFWAIGIPIYEGYGLTETSPVLTLSREGRVRPGYVGEPLLDTWEGKPFLVLAEDGEILVRGPNIMQGYWNDEKSTRETIDADGYCHTGDIAVQDRLGRIKITDRKKELIVISNGKNVAPQPIENLLRADKYIEQAVLIGDRRNYITALIYPHMETLRRWAEKHHIHAKDDAELVAHPKVLAKIMSRVEHVNSQISKFERILKITLLSEEMSAENGLLTASLKVKRRMVNMAYKEAIEKMYGAEVVTKG